MILKSSDEILINGRSYFLFHSPKFNYMEVNKKRCRSLNAIFICFESCFMLTF